MDSTLIRSKCQSLSGRSLLSGTFEENSCWHGINLFSFVADQNYDNAATLSGRLTRLPMRLLARNPKATFKNCANHSLNPAVLHAANVDSSITSLFGTMQQLLILCTFSITMGEIADCLQDNSKG